MSIKIQKKETTPNYISRPDQNKTKLPIEWFKVTHHNVSHVAKWCGGDIVQNYVMDWTSENALFDYYVNNGVIFENEKGELEEISIGTFILKYNNVYFSLNESEFKEFTKDLKLIYPKNVGLWH